MALQERPIRSIFASIHRYPPGEAERINEALEAQYRRDILMDEAAEAIVCALGDYQPPNLGRGWQPQGYEATTPWRSRLEAYTFAGMGADDAHGLFAKFCRQLHGDSPDFVNVAESIFQWGRVRPRLVTAEHVISVRDVAMAGIIPQQLTPWSSSYTKIAAAATYRDDIEPTSQVLPQVIWDSRVSYAVARLATQALVDNAEALVFLQKHLLVVPGRGGNRVNDGTWTRELRRQGWRFAVGSWSQRYAAFWQSQVNGSKLVHAMARQLNVLPQLEKERRKGHRWTSFDVALALFVEGY